MAITINRREIVTSGNQKLELILLSALATDDGGTFETMLANPQYAFSSVSFDTGGTLDTCSVSLNGRTLTLHDPLDNSTYTIWVFGY